MSFKLFKNSKAARRHLPSVRYNILAVDKLFKPSYLWDAFNAESEEVESYIKELRRLGEIKKELKILLFEGNLFVVHLESIELRLNELRRAINVCIIDASRRHALPIEVTLVDKEKVLKSIIDVLDRCLVHKFREGKAQTFGSNSIVINVSESDVGSCNMTTLIGALLGYPALYWYDSCMPDCNYDPTCLSMVPLKVLKVHASVNPTIRPSPSKCYLGRAISAHELYSFSIPEMLSKETNSLIDTWFQRICSLHNEDCIFTNIQLVSNTVTLPSIVM